MEQVALSLDSSRLVTLTGPPGVGKTRIAVELAALLADDYDDGAWLLELAGTTDPEAVPQLVATALRAAELPGRPALEAVIDHLSTREVLLVLDGCERIAGACAEFVHRVLSVCRRVAILVTSQQLLGAAGERTWHVPALSLPPQQEPASSPSGDGDQRPSAAVTLFCDRATAVHARFKASEESARAIDEICRRLDGLPLAIELAAERTRVLSPAQIAARLDERFELLVASGHSPDARHRSLSAAFDWAYDLLSPPEADLLARLSVFSGGATLEAVAEVCDGGELAGEQLLECLSGLVSKSWVAADTSSHEVRYSLLETGRRHAAKRSDAIPLAEVQRRHADWYLAMAERVERELNGANQLARLDTLDAEHDNMRAAMDWAISTDNAQHGLRLAGALSEFWRIRAYFDEGTHRLEAALAAGRAKPGAVRAKALRGAASLRTATGDWPGATALLEEALALSRRVGDDSGTADALHRLGLMAVMVRDLGRGVPMIEEALALARSLGDTAALAASLFAKGQSCVFGQDPPGARVAFEECLEVARHAGDAQRVGDALSGLCWTVRAQGDLVEAERLLSEVLSSVREVGIFGADVIVLSSLAEVHRIHGRYDEARSLAQEGVDIASQANAPQRLAMCLSQLGKLALTEQDWVGAESLFEQVLSISSPGRPGFTKPGALLGIGEARLGLGDTAGARSRFEEALAGATQAGDRTTWARALHGLGDVARLCEEDEHAASLYRQALLIQQEVNDAVGVIESLEALGHLASSWGRHDRAARLLGAAQALRDAPHLCCARSPRDAKRYEASMGSLRQSLGDDGLEAALVQGGAMSEREAVAYALRGRRAQGGPTTGWGSLTGAEREVVNLVQLRLTNAEIGERLFISPRTVQTHLTHIFAKLGLSSRRALAEEATRRQDGEDERRDG